MNYTIEIYRLDVANAKFVLLDIITTFTGLTYFNGLNEIGAAKFTLESHDLKASQANLVRFANQVVIKRNGVIVWFGPITSTTTHYEDVRGTIEVDCNTYLFHLQNRFTAKLVQYTNTDQASIAWGLINTSQLQTNGTLLISEGSTTSTGILQSVSYEYTTLATAITDLSNLLNGFDFVFNPIIDSNGLLTGVSFDMYYPYKGSVLSNVVPITIGEGGNVKSIQTRTATDLINHGIAEGAGTGTPISSVLDYGGSQLGYTRRESYQSYKDISVPSQLSALLTAYMNLQSVERQTIDITLYPDKKPLLTEFGLGDILSLDLSIANSGGYLDYQGQGRTLEISVDVDSQGAENITPKFSLIY